VECRNSYKFGIIKYNMNKKGMSMVITTFLVILLMLVSIGVIWAVVKNVVGGSGQVSLDKFTSDFQIERVLLSEDDVKVVVERGNGNGELVKINFVIDDGENSESFEIEVDLQALGKAEFTLVPVELVIADIKNIKISPIYSSGSNEEVSGVVSDSFNVENLNIVEGDGEGEGDGGDEEDGECDPACDFLHICNEETLVCDEIPVLTGLVLWWDFNGNAIDEIEELTGVVEGAILTTGHFDQAYEFDSGEETRIIVQDSNIFDDISSEITFSLWIKVEDMDTKQKPIHRHGWMEIIIEDNELEVKWENDEDGSLKPSVTNLESYENQWIHVVSTISGNQAKLYLNGEEATPDSENDFGFKNGGDFYIGSKENFDDPFSGVIDEIMVFDRALSDSEVLELYGLSSI